MDLRTKAAVAAFLVTTVFITNFFMGLILESRDRNIKYKDENDYMYLLVNILMWHAVTLGCFVVMAICIVAYHNTTYKDAIARLTGWADRTDKLTVLAFVVTLTILFGIGMYIIEGKYIDSIAFEVGFPFSSFAKLKLRRVPDSHNFTRKMIEAFNLFAVLLFAAVLFFYTW